MSSTEDRERAETIRVDVLLRAQDAIGWLAAVADEGAGQPDYEIKARVDAINRALPTLKDIRAFLPSPGGEPSEALVYWEVALDAVITAQRMPNPATERSAKEARQKMLSVLRADLTSGSVGGETREAVKAVLAERRRQVEVEGWTPEHDDMHGDREMALAAAAYAVVAATDCGPHEAPAWWPWSQKWWKPRDERANLVRAGALILAEIERIDRASSPTQTPAGS